MQQAILRNRIQDYTGSINQSVIDYIVDGQIETYESFETLDLIAFDWYATDDVEAPPAQILIYLDKEHLFFFCENEASLAIVHRMFVEDSSNEHAMYLFFRNLLKGNVKYMEQLETRVSELDDDVSDGTEEGLREKLISMRNEVSRIHKYYEQMVLLFEEMCDNDNGLFSDACLKYLEVLRNRSVRFATQARNLKEYVTQVRESYQAQIAIEQNDLMKVFTLVTSIFMPLTLIAGWYGMNLKMPEFGWRHGYFFVIALSVVVCLIWIAVFKKKKWFK